MKGYIPIEIPTKRYIKAYLMARYGDKPIMSSDSMIGNKLYDLLQNKRNEDRKRFANKRYNAKIRIYVFYHVFNHRGANLHETNLKRFNLFVEQIIKEQFYFLMDTYIDMLPSFESNLPEVRRRLGITVHDWDSDSMRKDYYRYRLRTARPLLYEKSDISAVTVPSVSNADAAF